MLAQGQQGWAAMCRLVSVAHDCTTPMEASGGDGVTERRRDPAVTLDEVADAAGAGSLGVVLGPHSDVGRALARRRPDLAVRALDTWRDAVGDQLVLQAVSHRAGGDRTAVGSTRHAAAMLGLGREHAVPVVLANAVRYADRADATVVDVLDAARRLVPLDARHLDRTTAEGYLKSGEEMRRIADEVVRATGGGPADVARLLGTTRSVAERFVLDPRADLGLGEIHFPEHDLLSNLSTSTAAGAVPGAAAGTGPSRGAGGLPSADAVLRAQCEAGITRRYGSRPGRDVLDRLAAELDVIAQLGYAAYFLTVAEV